MGEKGKHEIREKSFIINYGKSMKKNLLRKWSLVTIDVKVRKVLLKKLECRGSKKEENWDETEDEQNEKKKK